MKRENKKNLPKVGLKLYGHRSTKNGDRFTRNLAKMKYFDIQDSKFKKINKELAIKNIIEQTINLNTARAKFRKIYNLRPTIGTGNYNAKIMFIGDEPTRYDVLSGIPFCGKAGEVLDECLKSINLTRRKVYITNIIKDFTTSSFTASEEINQYLDILKYQIDFIKPKIIVGLGQFTVDILMTMFGLSEHIRKLIEIRGKKFSLIDGKILMFMFHLATVIYNDDLKQILLNDFKKLERYI